ncbi:9090_t:CDS:1, partial [Gigaspora rosea]
QPYFQLVKNKIGIARTAGNYIISHRGMMACKLLEQELCIKQISLLQNRLNNDGIVLKLARIRIKQGLLNAGLVDMEWKSEEDKELQ